MTGPGERPLDRGHLLAARLRAAHDRPYLASALYALTVVPTSQVPTMGVDRHWRCYVNPDFVAATPVEQLAAVWIHETAHLLRDHHGRAARLPAARAAQHTAVNVAQDLEINDDLITDGLTLPPGRLVPWDFDLPAGRTFEEYLEMLPAGHTADCGSGAHNCPAPWDIPPDAAPSVSDLEARSIRRQTAHAIRARERGTTPRGWLRWATQILEPTVDWRQALAGSVRQAIAAASGAVDYTYQRPSRRAAAMPGVVQPRLRKPIPSVAVVVDTSGSMSDDDLTAARAEITGVLREVGIRGDRIVVISCDAVVASTQQVHSSGDVRLTGGGGTDMRVGITAALATPRRPDVIIVLTDGATPWPDHPVPARVIAGLIGRNPPAPPSWIEVVRITDQGSPR